MFDALTGWDWFVLTVAVLSVGIGALRGLVRTVFALGAWVVGLLGVPLASPFVLPLLPDGVPRPLVYFLVFLVLFVAVRLLGGLAARALRGIGLGGADRLLGAVLGLARAAVIVVIAAVAAHLAGQSRSAAWQKAQTRPLLDEIVRQVEPFLPERVTGVRRT
jgi:membrane protein required for colicin V production